MVEPVRHGSEAGLMAGHGSGILGAMPAAAVLHEVERSAYHGARMTLAAYEATLLESNIKPYLEFWDGLVIQKAVPSFVHGVLQVLLARRLGDWADVVGGFVTTETHVWFAGHGYRLPDVAYWAPRRLTVAEGKARPPTLAIEILSDPSDRESDRAKCRLMRANGVDVCWLIDPDRRTVELFDDGRDGENLSGDTIVTSPRLPGFALDLRDIFSVLDR